jgi:hypothetical protein
MKTGEMTGQLCSRSTSFHAALDFFIIIKTIDRVYFSFFFVSVIAFSCGFENSSLSLFFC